MINEKNLRHLISRGCSDRMDSEQILRDTVIGGEGGLLEAMGWSFDRGEWKSNVAVSFGSVTHHMDYLVGIGESQWILEAKNPINKLDRDKDVKELLSYMKQKGSKYGILYNGKELLAFKLNSDYPFYEWSCDKNKVNIEIFKIFSNDKFPSKLENFIKSEVTSVNLQNYVKKNADNIKNKIIDLVAKNSGISRELVNQYFPFLISLFSNETVSRRSKLGPHLTESKAREIVLQILKDYNGKPLRRLEIVKEAERRINLTDVDKEIYEKSKIPRWKAAVRFAVSSLKKDGLIKSLESNQWILEEKK